MSIRYILELIINNCRNPHKKEIAINFLTYKMNMLEHKDKLKIELWQIIKELEQIN